MHKLVKAILLNNGYERGYEHQYFMISKLSVWVNNAQTLILKSLDHSQEL